MWNLPDILTDDELFELADVVTPTTAMFAGHLDDGQETVLAVDRADPVKRAKFVWHGDRVMSYTYPDKELPALIDCVKRNWEFVFLEVSE